MTAKCKNLFMSIVKNKWMYFLVLPGLAFYLIFGYGPMYGIILAFKDFYPSKGIMGSPWVGLSNYRWILIDATFMTAFKNTLTISLMKILLGFTPPIILAIALSELNTGAHKKTLQTMFTFPHFLSWVVISGMTVTLFKTNGTVDGMLSLLGMGHQNLLANPSAFRYLLYFSDIWKEAGWSSIIYLAAITSINPEIYEAAKVDGAGRLRCIVHITLPELIPTASVLLILAFGNVMNAGFDQIFNMYNPVVQSGSDIIDTYVYRLAFAKNMGNDYSFATAVGLLKSLLNFVLLLIANKSVRLTGGSGIF